MGKKHRAVNIGAFGIALLICIATVNLAFADPTITTNSPLPDALLNTAY
ncbi:MAG: hypothetical protein HY811_07875, partial [Planctomycetes bacterium]|nr:hypothetical protein [Planctomycetota bacterium]